MRDLTSKLFGKATYFFSVCEFQKRGLPHAHIVIKFDGASPEARHEVEKWIWTNLPDKRIAGGKLREKVFHMLSIVAQEYACDAYSRQEDNVLNFIGSGNCQKRITNYKAIRRAQRRNTNRKTLTSVISCFTCEPEKKAT